MLGLKVLRKARNVSQAISENNEEEDLFIDTDPTFASSSTLTDKAIRREQYIQMIASTSSLPCLERKRVASQTRVGIIRKIAQLSETAEDLGQLYGALRGWRLMGMRVTAKATQEIIGDYSFVSLPRVLSLLFASWCMIIVGRCCNLGRPEIAVDLIKDQLQCMCLLT